MRNPWTVVTFVLLPLSLFTSGNTDEYPKECPLRTYDQLLVENVELREENRNLKRKFITRLGRIDDLEETNEMMTQLIDIMDEEANEWRKMWVESNQRIKSLQLQLDRIYKESAPD
jgi:hypothetical protein